MNKCHAVLVPSTRPDPLPTIAIEALAAGRYLIGSSSGGIPEILAAAPGMLVAPGDVDAWHTALEELDLEGCLKALTASRKRYEDEFTVIAFRRRFSTVLSQVWPELPCVAVQDTSH